MQLYLLFFGFVLCIITNKEASATKSLSKNNIKTLVVLLLCPNRELCYLRLVPLHQMVILNSTKGFVAKYWRTHVGVLTFCINLIGNSGVNFQNLNTTSPLSPLSTNFKDFGYSPLFNTSKNRTNKSDSVTPHFTRKHALIIPRKYSIASWRWILRVMRCY